MRVRAALVLLLWPTFVQADRCAELRDLVEEAGSGQMRIDPVAVYADAQDCSVSRDERGGKTYLCHWAFPYRDAAATTAFEALDQEVRQCFDDAVTLPTDLAVNHPDSYDLRRYQFGQAVISASLKDKAALSQSLIFLRIDQE